MKSLASEATDYVPVQIRKTGFGTLHVQGKGAKTNRAYGVAGNVNVDAGLSTWIDTVETSHSSLANTGKQYISAQVARRGSNFHFQILSDSSPFVGVGSRDYGAVFDIPVDTFSSLSEFIDVNQTFDEGVDTDDCCHPGCCSD